MSEVGVRIYFRLLNLYDTALTMCVCVCVCACVYIYMYFFGTVNFSAILESRFINVWIRRLGNYVGINC
jgi:hypothetical protein